MVKRTINFRFLAVTLIAGAVVAGATYGLHKWQIARTSRGLVALADAQEQKSEWLKAADYLDRYLRLHPDDAPTAGRLALSYARGAKYTPERQRAVSLHYRALALDQGERSAEVRGSLGNLLLELGRLGEAESEARKILAASPNDPLAERVLALALAGQWFDGSLARANLQQLAILSTVEKARASNSSDSRVALALATLLRESTEVCQAEFPQLNLLDRQKRADVTMDALVSDNPQSGPLALARYFYRIKYALPDAESDLNQAVRLAPDDTEVLLAAGTSALDVGRRLKVDPLAADKATAELTRAKGFFERLVAKPAEERLPIAYLSLGDVQLALGDREAALQTWQTGLKNFRQPTVQINLQAKIAESLLEADRADEAQPALDEIEKLVDRLGTSVPRNVRLAFERERDLRRARWHVQRAELAQAIPLLRSVALRQPQGDPQIDTTLQAQFLLGSIQLRLGEWVEAAVAFDEASRLAPGRDQMRLAAGRAYLAAGRPRMAAQRAEQALDTAPTVEGWLLLAAAELQQQNAAAPAERNWRRFLEALDTLEQNRNKLAENAPWRIDFLRIDYLLAQARATGSKGAIPAEVTDRLKTAEAAYADQKAFWMQVGLAYQNLELWSDAERALGELQKAGGTAVEIAAAQARLAGRRGDYAAAEKTLEAAAKTAAVKDRDTLQAELLRLAFAAKDLTKVRAILQDQHRRQTGDLTVIRRLAELELEARDFAAVTRWAQEAAKPGNGAPGQLLAQYLLGWRTYLTAGKGAEAELRKALANAEAVVLARPTFAAAVALKGLIEIRLGQLDQAVSDLERAVDLGERRLVVYEQLVALLESQQRWSDAEAYLSRLAGELPRSQGLAEAAASIELHRDQPEDAVKIARQSAQQRPDDPRAHLWLGRMLAITGEFDEAEQSLEKAVELGPADPPTWSGLLGLFARTKEEAKAAAVLARLEQNTQIDATQMKLLLAQGYEVIGRTDQARSRFDDLARLTASDLNMQLRVAQFHLKSNPREAERILRDALAANPQSHAARRMLALAVASQGDKGLEEAQTLLTQAGVEEAVASDDQRIRALLLARQGGFANLERAVQILEGLIANQPSPAPGDRQLLAQLYERQTLVMDDPAQIASKLTAAQSAWELAAEASDAPPASLAAVVQFLVRQGRKSDAIAWLDKLEAAVKGQATRNSDQESLVVQMQVIAGASDRSEKWLAGLDKSGLAGGLRALTLEARVAADRDQQADIEALVEPRANELLSSAGKPADQAAVSEAIGQLYTSLKQHALAERWYRRLVELAPAQYALLAGSLTRQERLADAITVCGEATKTDATTRPAMVLVAALTEGRPSEQDFKQAAPIIAAAVAKFPADVDLLYAVTLVNLLEGKHDDAIRHYRQILASNPRHVAALNNLAMLLAERPADRAEALRLVDLAIEIVGKDPGLLDTKGAILVYSSRPAEALPLLLSATRGESADPRHHLHLAVAYRDLGQLDEAKAQLKIALDRNLDRQLLMPTDQRLLAEMRAQLLP